VACATCSFGGEAFSLCVHSGFGLKSLVSLREILSGCKLNLHELETTH
jgi:hypothetical protein